MTSPQDIKKQVDQITLETIKVLKVFDEIRENISPLTSNEIVTTTNLLPSQVERALRILETLKLIEDANYEGRLRYYTIPGRVEQDY